MPYRNHNQMYITEWVTRFITQISFFFQSPLPQLYLLPCSLAESNVILLTDTTDLHLSSLGTLVPEALAMDRERKRER